MAHRAYYLLQRKHKTRLHAAAVRLISIVAGLALGAAALLGLVFGRDLVARDHLAAARGVLKWAFTRKVDTDVRS